ncbi:unnamed protein product [Adineta ricciae]|uniref:Uncharacterized protein n=1 Tax=Adineta ricciae TaxID=249248 RepID=A0A816ANI2_ADIRI|nr:unnamed protein product [Adineta ricciae]
MADNTTSVIPDDLNTPEIIRIKYIVLQVLQIFSWPIYFFVFFHILTNKTQRKSLNNHVIIVLLLSNSFQLFFDLSLVLSWLHQGIIRPATPATCYFWNFMNYWAYYTSFIIMLWASFELGWCGFMCYQNYAASWILIYEYLAHEIIPMFLEVFLSILLILRVVFQRRQGAHWRRNRKMILQLLSISFLSTAFNIPDVISPLYYLIFDVELIAENIQEFILAYVGYGTCIFLPITCLTTIPHVKEKLFNMIDYRRWLDFEKKQQRIVPTSRHP